MDCNCKKYQKSLTHVSNELKNIKRFMTISWLPGILSQFNNEDLILLISHVEQLEIQLESLDNLVTAINHSIKITNH